ncbi:MAG: hypothetical protein L3J39_17075 [Verrucomicrobiales bacterium]|nr:hypothetical protein [Verrucomicrobiales bacterium]
MDLLQLHDAHLGVTRSTTIVAETITDDKVEIFSKSYDGNGGQKPNVKVVRNTLVLEYAPLVKICCLTPGKVQWQPSAIDYPKCQE